MVLNNYIELLTSPATFFRKMDRVKTYFDPWLFFIIFGLFEIVTQLPLVIIDYANAATEDALIQLIAVVVGFGMLPITPFIAAGIAHLGMMILGHDGYYKTFKPMTYALTISVPYSIGLILLSAIMLAVGSSAAVQPRATGQGTVFVILLGISVFLLSITSVVHTVYTACVGAAHTHHTSKLRAFCGMYLIPTALMFVLVIIPLMLLTMFLFGAAILSMPLS